MVTSCASVATAASVALISGPVRPAPVATVHGLGGAGVGLARVRAAPYYLYMYCIYSATVSTVIQSCTRTFGRGKVRAVNLAGAGSNLVALTGSMRIFDCRGQTDILANTAYPSFESTTDRTPTRS